MSSRQTEWESRYAAAERLWSGAPNDWLSLATDWIPGRSLDVGCGEGADVLWLAEHGWRATGVDFAPTAVERMLAEARRRGLAERVRGLVLDLSAAPLPPGPFDLVTSFYVHGGPAPGSLDLPRLLVRLTELVDEGGRLLTAVHCVNPPWHRHHALTYRPEALTDAVLDAAAGTWDVEVSEERWRDAVSPDGEPGRRSDAVVCLRRSTA
ncbi:class I SAM-dependent methyltransferase [Actinomyces sp. MRS3W]|uniref:class I SAM-dependent methyltransferase n=1 Tax=Actinomyces sp. MRS3W TaxID=2800796 RepID=UPI0028FD4DDE|nr:class I SAM-dependent methyltransferase [Actinomyces sp. MRS3W]MDU0347356.1 class I SAM-dependent methyltransferase [Actinomyces sp. MRS3W]